MGLNHPLMSFLLSTDYSHNHNDDNHCQDSATALTSLIYPMRYSHTLVPVLPHSLLEVCML